MIVVNEFPMSAMTLVRPSLSMADLFKTKSCAFVFWYLLLTSHSSWVSVVVHRWSHSLRVLYSQLYLQLQPAAQLLPSQHVFLHSMPRSWIRHITQPVHTTYREQSTWPRSVRFMLPLNTATMIPWSLQSGFQTQNILLDSWQQAMVGKLAS